ncbi:hypothetical protein FEDK69T_24790 [Flavobacterium enshiense DK69]|uniref:Uncharacterized protein n=1 Tax=Flavobacterium enshiense DK69 TaxID=1107311 RepID=V6S570_9FLAO|nr:hypothetical protein [Flavobacterium enshiense]ESU21412.1 hypothetical protein FEDK69T_24790 [Flavobacterium enshiense DK69]KGO97079.1 hypothetical protein Q767_00290 [Flavobacterium enshiense DK69]
MKAQSTDKKTFQLTENGQQLGELIYENLFFLNAEIKLTSSDVFEIKPVGLFQTSINVTQNGTEIAKLVMNWRGEIVISYQDGEEYVLKLNTFFFGKYIIENKKEEKIIQLDPKFNWREFHYNYDIVYNITDDNKSKDPLLLLLGVYATNYFVACMSGSSAGMM